MIDYYSVRIDLTPCEEDFTDLLAAYLADIGYESFVADEKGLTAYVNSSTYDEQKLLSVFSDFPFDTEYSCKADFVKGEDWNSEWERNYFQPIVIGDRCVVHSSFHKNIPKATYDIVIDPKMAFGTGHHSTTNLIVSYLLDMDLEGKKVTDVGTGTAILAILAKMRGASDVTGIEIDPCAYENAKENAAINNVDLRLLLGDASEIGNVPVADLLMANINRNIVIADLERYAAGLAPGGAMILSGFYTEDIDKVMDEARKYGLQLAEKRSDNNWAAIMLRKKSN